MAKKKHRGISITPLEWEGARHDAKANGMKSISEWLVHRALTVKLEKVEPDAKGKSEATGHTAMAQNLQRVAALYEIVDSMDKKIENMTEPVHSDLTLRPLLEVIAKEAELVDPEEEAEEEFEEDYEEEE
jgi:hypothetical protein